MIAIPISGHIASESEFRGVLFLGLFTFPDLTSFDRDLHQRSEDLHEVLVKILFPLVGISLHAALKYHFWNKDATLQRVLKTGQINFFII
jgi:cytochrome b561